MRTGRSSLPSPLWRRDGKEVFYVAPDRKLLAVTFDARTGSAGVPHVLFQTWIVAPRFAFFQRGVAPGGCFLINSFTATILRRSRW